MQVVSLESIGKTLLVKTAFSQHCLSAIREGKYNDLANLLNYNEEYEWAMVELD
jgi:hypothetical protein